MSKEIVGRTIAVLVVALFGCGVGFDQFDDLGLTQPAYITLAILLVAATLWVSEAVPLFVTSLIVLFLCVVWLTPSMVTAEIAVTKDDFFAPFFSDIIVLFLGGFAISAALHKRQLDEWLAMVIIRRTGDTMPKLMFGVMVATAFLSMWVSNTATAAMMLATVLPIASRLPKESGYGRALILSVPFAANIGGLGTPIGTPPNAIAMQYMSGIGIQPGFATWMMIGIPGVLGMLCFAWMLLIVIARRSEQPQSDEATATNQHTALSGVGDDTSLSQPIIDSDPIALATGESMVRLQKDRDFFIIVITVLITALGWMTAALHGQSSGTVAMIPLLVFFGTGVLDSRDLRKMSWDVLLMMGGGLCLGTAIAESGLALWLVDQLPIDGLTPYWLTVLFSSF
ncbi:MAG: SLC13 family permease, partial [Planctomycetota bacterium]